MTFIGHNTKHLSVILKGTAFSRVLTMGDVVKKCPPTKISNFYIKLLFPIKTISVYYGNPVKFFSFCFTLLICSPFKRQRVLGVCIFEGIHEENTFQNI